MDAFITKTPRNSSSSASSSSTASTSGKVDHGNIISAEKLIQNYDKDFARVSCSTEF